MGLTIRSSHKQELSSVYQFIDVLYSLCIYEALRHWSLSCLLLLRVSRFSSALYLCRAIYTKLVAIWLATIGRCYYWSHTSARSVRLYTGECVVDSSTGLWDRACWLYRGQHGSWAFSIHVLVDVSTSIIAGSGFEPTTVCAASRTLCTIRPLRLGTIVNLEWRTVGHKCTQVCNVPLFMQPQSRSRISQMSGGGEPIWHDSRWNRFPLSSTNFCAKFCTSE